MDTRTIRIVVITALSVIVLAAIAAGVYWVILSGKRSQQAQPYMEPDTAVQLEPTAFTTQSAPSPVEDISDVDREVEYLDKVVSETSDEALLDDTLEQ